MSNSQYGRKLDPYRRLREPMGVKGIRQSVVVTNNPSKIDQGQQLLVRFPNLGPEAVIIPGTARLAFTISLNSTDANRSVVQNLARALVKKLVIRISGNEILSIDDSDVYHCYADLWKTPSERSQAQYQGLDSSDDMNVTKLRLGAGDADSSKTEDQAIADTYGNRYNIPLDFELLESHMPYYQSALGDRLEYELTFNDYNRVVLTTSDPTASYTVDNISLEFEQVSHPDVARLIRSQYVNGVAIYYDRILRLRKVVLNKKDTLWNVNINVPARSMKGVLMLFEDASKAKPYARDTEHFYNPKIEKVEMIIEGVPNQLYAQGLHKYQLWSETRKLFPIGSKHHAETATVIKDLSLSNVSLGEFLTNKYALWLDLRTTDDAHLHGTGRRVENASEGITIQITKKLEPGGVLNLYLYIVQDAQINIKDGRFVSAIY